MGRGSGTIQATGRELLFGRRRAGQRPIERQRRDQLPWIDRSRAYFDGQDYSLTFEYDAEQLTVLLAIIAETIEQRGPNWLALETWRHETVADLGLLDDCTPAEIEEMVMTQPNRVASVGIATDRKIDTDWSDDQGELFPMLELLMANDDHDQYADLGGRLARWTQHELALLPQPASTYRINGAVHASDHSWTLNGPDLFCLEQSLRLAGNHGNQAAKILRQCLGDSHLIKDGYPNYSSQRAAERPDRLLNFKLNHREHETAREALVAYSEDEHIEQVASLLALTEG